MATVLRERKWLVAVLVLGLVLVGTLAWWIFHSDAITWHTGNPVTAIAFSPDGQWLASAEETHNALGETKDPLVIVRHSPDGQMRATLTGYDLTIYSLAFS